MHEFTLEIHVGKVAKPVPGRALGARHCYVIAQKDGKDVFQAHQFVAGATHNPVSRLDPKIMLFDGGVYELDRGYANPYEGLRIRGWLYGRWRRLTCPFVRHRWFLVLTEFWFPRSKNALQTIREAFHRMVWIIGAHIFYRG